MKLFSLMMVAALAIGCGGSKKTTTDPKDNTTQPTGSDATATGDGQPCTQEVALQCPDGQTDACLKTPPDGDKHKCVAK